MPKQFHLIGAHTSIAGGLPNALYRGKNIGCDVVQIFSKNQMQWKAKPITKEQIEQFKRAVEETEVVPVTIHDAYLINLGSNNSATLNKSRDAFSEELIRCEQLGIPYLVMHPGSHLGDGEEEGMCRIAENIRKTYHQSGVEGTIVLLETTAGQGTNLGWRFEQLAEIMKKTGLNEKIAVCLDTCHVFAAGYDIRTAKVWNETKVEFDRIIGLEKLKALHLNDSKRERGSRVDRHERIGSGKIGKEAFGTILNDPDLVSIPMILEIPGGETAYKEDLHILKKLLNPASTE